MAELDVALRQLGRGDPVPADAGHRLGGAQASRAASSLEAPSRGIALAVLAVAVGAVLAVPPARTAVYRLARPEQRPHRPR